ncbi:carboxypeptidase M32 [Longimicrobium sp.]|uniref:carboxypeptidase M32 n=1 Tax=Longimicrobium sp. TaxID=2029185 RepID=UPI002E31B55D|nr:carboxypeptidase M32 [Longimicrobium sp.]HEX6040672.1 carboxypeptidase M32 [Longimicrobium sp.]
MPDTASTEPMTPYRELLGELREIAVLGSISATLGWDQEVMMPPAAAGLRGEQAAALSTLVHERRTSPRLADLIARCEADTEVMTDPDAAANLRNIRHDYDRATRLPTELVRETAETTTLAMHAWRENRERSDFAGFAPWLTKLVDLNRRTAEALGVPEGGELYDALLDSYEPGMRAAELDRVFGELRAGLVPLIRELRENGTAPSTEWMNIPLDIAKQVAFNRGVVERMGFDFSAGRLDESTHPFCEGAGPGDTRLTTRYDAGQMLSALHGTMHETGHGLYEQGLPKAERFGQPLAEAASMGVHESQSRMWENFVGRGRPFWVWALPELQRQTGDAAIGALDVDTVFRGLNTVEPNLIRIESDEATYNLHIMLRYDLERAMLKGDLSVADLPGAWNERMRNDLGLEVPDDRRGVLQDIHWSMGAIGYFPTYTLGNLYAAQLWDALTAALPELDSQLSRGELGGLLGWLRANVHTHGRRYTAPELCERATGRPLSHEPLLRYLEGKLRPVYGL